MRYLLAVVSLLLLSSPALAQRFYVRAAAGYAVPILSTPLIINGTPYTVQAPSSSTQAFSEQYSISQASMAAGIQGNLHAGYWFSKNIGVDVGMDILISPKKYTGMRPYGLNTGSGKANLELTEYAKGLKLATIGVAIRQTEFLKGVYVNAGLVLPLNTKIIAESHSLPDSGQPTTYSKTEIHLNYGIGFYGILGYSYKISKHFAVTGNLSITALALWAKESHLRAYTVDGQDQSAFVAEEWREIVYDKNYATQNAYTAGPDGRRVLPSYQMPFSNLSFKLGIEYSL